MRQHALDVTETTHRRGDATARLRRQPLIGNGLDEFPGPKTAGVTRGLASRQRMIGAHALVAIGDGAFLTNK